MRRQVDVPTIAATHLHPVGLPAIERLQTLRRQGNIQYDASHGGLLESEGKNFATTHAPYGARVFYA